MPVITIESSKMNKEQKGQLVKEFTQSAANILKLPESVFTVYIKEYENENIGFCGKLLSDK